MKFKKMFLPVLFTLILSLSVFTSSASANLHWSEGFMYTTAAGYKSSFTGGTSYTTSNVHKSTGYRYFNYEGASGSYTKRVGIEDSNDWIDAWAAIHPLNGARGNINIAYWYKNNRIVNKSVSNLQRYSLPSSTIAGRYGSWTVAWTTAQKMRWDMKLTYWHYKPAYQCGPAGCKGTSVISPEPEVSGEIVEEEILVAQTYNSNNELEEFSVEQIGDYNFIIPSTSHKNKKGKKAVYNYEELYTLPYDEVNGEYVYDMPGYEIDDTIKFSDRITALNYDSKNDTTMISFKNEGDVGGWSFKGDLRNKFHLNEKVKMKFKVVPFLKGTTYETLDVVSDSSASSIEKYLD